MPTSLVDNLRPVARDEVRLADRILRATTSSGQVTANGTTEVLVFDMSGYASFVIELTGDSNTFGVEGSNDLAKWGALDITALGRTASSLGSTFVQENAAPTLIGGNKQTRFVRIASPASGGVSGVTVLLSQTALVPMPREAQASWTYVAASGGITTTPGTVTLRASQNIAHRNLIQAMQLDNGSATGTEVTLTDSVAASVIWRGYMPGNSSKVVKFDPPLAVSANAAITAAVGTAGAAVYINAQGRTALA